MPTSIHSQLRSVNYNAQRIQPRLRGRRAVAQRLRRLRSEPLCRDCAGRGIVREATVPDHIVPLTKGGSDDDSNIRCLCADCHRSRRRAVQAAQDGRCGARWLAS
ncbi:HNH endonuclease [Sphingopyxis sp. 113P3]|uniref:HNH endonuclease n=2 Tax=Sphingopyxis TaxID=165697 RepID=UPI00130E4AB5|nr:HNH endonuclease signature motif containing protein [Sphingopyxis sp. 113P3]